MSYIIYNLYNSIPFSIDNWCQISERTYNKVYIGYFIENNKLYRRD